MSKQKHLEFYMTSRISDDMDENTDFACIIGNIIHRFINHDWGNIYSNRYFENKTSLENGGKIEGFYETKHGDIRVVTDDGKSDHVVIMIMYADED